VTCVEEFRDYFAQFGTITDAQIMKDRATNRSRGFGFVTFDHESAVDKCLETSHKLNNKLVEVKKAEPKRTMPTSAPYSPVYNSAYSPALSSYHYSAGTPTSPHAYVPLNSPGYPYILTNFNGELLYYADVSQLEQGSNTSSPVLTALHVPSAPLYSLNAAVSEVHEHY
jgi:RNA recognition motif-containing protein